MDVKVEVKRVVKALVREVSSRNKSKGNIKANKYKIGLFCIKVIPVFMFIIMWLHVGLLLFNINGPCADTIAGSALFPSIIILSISEMLNFCWLHKSMTIYSLVVDIFINYERYIGFGVLLLPLRILSFVSGIIVALLLLFNIKKFIYKCCTFNNIVYVEHYQEFTTQSN